MRYFLVGYNREHLLFTKIEEFQNQTFLEVSHNLTNSSPNVVFNRVALRLYTPQDTVQGFATSTDSLEKIFGMVCDKVIYIDGWDKGLSKEYKQEIEDLIKSRVRPNDKTPIHAE